MGQAEFTLTGRPAEGERYMTTGDLREYLQRLRAFKDDGQAEVTVKLGWRNRIKSVRATITPPEPVATEWDVMLADARMGVKPALPAGPMPGDDGEGSPVPGFQDGDTLAGIPAIPPGPKARLEPRRGGVHARP